MRRSRRAKTDKIASEPLVRALLAYKRGEPRVCAMMRVPKPEEEDRRRLCRERKTLTAERISHVNPRHQKTCPGKSTKKGGRPAEPVAETVRKI